ncbi:epidermal retinol dehydrogenase 2 [Aricia agestis]|uniref:epidermal retinol dehydrogenase 2 n=1 Tax=Aricia agestis TaxID=91739 RepID=UPI001C20A882|nr:epidermal retinol dehydrogenase 2 [Aricia agestis]
MLEGTKIHRPSQMANIFDIAKDTVLFLVLSCYYILESLFWTLVPNYFRPMKSLEGDVVVVTGAAGGVGRHLSLKLARLGAKVVLWDINKEALEKIHSAVKDEGYPVVSYVVDLANKEEVYETAERVKKEVGKVDMIINNAGIVYGDTFLELSDTAIETTYKVNILAHYWTVKAFLPDMISSGKGHIVTVSSVTGLLGTYRCTDYSATKFATVGFHESLFTELRAHGHDYIHATLVCPSYINTGMFTGVTPRLTAMLEPDYVADSIIESARKNEVVCVLPGSIRLFLPLKTLLPAKMCWDLMYRVMKGPQSMMTMKITKSR